MKYIVGLGLFVIYAAIDTFVTDGAAKGFEFIGTCLVIIMAILYMLIVYAKLETPNAPKPLPSKRNNVVKLDDWRNAA